MHNTWPVFWQPSSNADLRKYGCAPQRVAPIKQAEIQALQHWGICILLWSLQQAKASFYFILFKDPIILAVESLSSFAWNLHLEMGCLFPGPLTGLHIPFLPQSSRLLPPASATDRLWRVDRHASTEGLSLLHMWPPEQDINVNKRTSGQPHLFLFCCFSALTLLRARAKI